ncbi:MAG: serine protease [Actinomycetota bacterium]|nr:serine protease [Actinomycetota bacterium]
MASRGASVTPRPPARRPVRRRRYFHGGALSMVVLAATLAVVAALVATVVYAQIDAGRTISGDPVSEPRVPAPPPTVEEASTASTLPLLSPEELATRVDASVQALHTFDDAGQPVDATAFVVGSFGGQTLLLTSLAAVRAGIRAPQPPITLDGRNATLWTWHEERDLALLVIGGAYESLGWAAAPPRAGDKIFAGGAGRNLGMGVVTATPDGAIEHNIFTEPVRQGAPIVNQRGEVLAMASLTYNPSGKASDTVFIGVPIRTACERVLRCGSGNTSPGAATTTPTSPTTTP